MRTKLFSLLISLIITAVSYNSNAQENRQQPKFKKEKSYSKSYTISGNDKITLDNQFGEMKLTTWDKNEVKVEVSISGMADDETRAQEILNRITVTDEK